MDNFWSTYFALVAAVATLAIAAIFADKIMDAMEEEVVIKKEKSE